MRISFDVDDTLVCRGINMPAEHARVPAFLHRHFCEPLRCGTCEMMRKLRGRGWNIWIYTTSFRPSFYIRTWLFLYGIRIDGVINEDRHRRELAGRSFSH